MAGDFELRTGFYIGRTDLPTLSLHAEFRNKVLPGVVFWWRDCDWVFREFWSCDDLDIDEDANRVPQNNFKDPNS